jgi:hypothetical protein
VEAAAQRAFDLRRSLLRLDVWGRFDVRRWKHDFQ